MRLQNFLGELESFRNVAAASYAAQRNGKVQFTFEFRHKSWFCPEIYNLLKKFNAALVFSDTPYYPYVEEITANFVYLRLHGHERLYASNYTPDQLQEYAQKIKNRNKAGLEIWVFFDNDAQGNALQNAQELKNL